eukprot:TRINITY_DN1649_c0_g1_i3.p1 TRINITY_DN1649_c0_g1~~TRINITY_DN1649_c0_g1_i3.p1  ORF type:complete len:524 (-),score=140.41 TRINITY_DN1649_c0_g1_i3:22-1593(-)
MTSVALSDSDDEAYGDMMMSSGDEEDDMDMSSSSEDDGPFDEYDANLVGDEEDQRMLAQKTEIEREAIIAERYAARRKAEERRQARRDLKRRKRAQKEADKKSKKKKAPAKAPAKKKKNTSTPAASRLYRDDFEEEEDVPWSDDDKDVDYGQRSTTATEAPGTAEEEDELLDIDYADAKELQVRREQLEKWVDGDFLPEKLPGLFVRVWIGNDKVTKTPTYRLCTVLACKEKRSDDRRNVYRVGDKKTLYYLKVQIGNSSKNMGLDRVSNQEIKESEFQLWVKMMNRASKPLPTRVAGKRLLNNLQYMINYKFTEGDISKLIDKKKKFLKSVPVNLAEERATLLMKRDAYANENDEENLREVNMKIEELEERMREQESRLEKKTQSMKSINERNRKHNFERGLTTKEETEIVEDPLEKNPFTRRSCAPSVVSFVAPPSDAEVEAAKKAKAENRRQRQEVRTERTFAFSTERIKKTLDEAHDIHIEVDMNAEPTPMPFRFVPQRRPRPEDVLTLSDYKRQAQWQ